MQVEISHLPKKVSSSDRVANMLHAVLAVENEIDQNKEHFWAIGVNSSFEVQYLELVSLGDLMTSIVHPREVFRMAALKGVYAIMFGHNHPSGDCKPSDPDAKITKKLVSAGNILGIEVMDHVIIGRDCHFSFNDMGLL